MGILDFLLGRKKKEKEEKERPGQKQVEVEVPKSDSQFKLPEDVRNMSDSEKINLILQGVYSVYDELKPRTEDGGRLSRLNLILENLTTEERKEIVKKVEEIDIDEKIVNELDNPMSIEELSKILKKSYGYTAARLRHLKKKAKVTRKRDPETNKFVYMRVPG